MLRRLKRRARPDTHTNQARRPGGNVGRYVYLGLLAVFALGIANFLWGDVVILRSDGLVLRDQSVIAAPYTSRVESVYVREGQSVSAGSLLVRVKSAEVLERLADLSVRQAELARQSAETILRYKTAVQLLPKAAKRERETGGFVQRMEDSSDRVAVTAQTYESALSANYTAAEDRIRLSTEAETLKEQLRQLEGAQASATAAVNDLKALYADGAFTAQRQGSIGATIPYLGAVYNAGEPMLSLYSGDPYVLAYLPRKYMFRIERGMAVVISNGRHSARGVISEILPVSDALPQEFQNAFKPRDRNQLAKIRIDGTAVFPLFEKVKITRF
jgi:multidrug resistance efflux pump